MRSLEKNAEESAMTSAFWRTTTNVLSRGTSHIAPGVTAGLDHSGTPSTLRRVA